jgi:hypothetical protein
LVLLKHLGLKFHCIFHHLSFLGPDLAHLPSLPSMGSSFDSSPERMWLGAGLADGWYAVKEYPQGLNSCRTCSKSQQSS